MFPGWVGFIMQAKCVDFVLAVLYIVLVSLFLGGGLLHRIKGKKNSSPLSEASRDRSSVNPQKADTIHAQVTLCFSLCSTIHHMKFELLISNMDARCFYYVLLDATKHSTEKLGSAVSSTRILGQLLQVLSHSYLFLLSF